MAKQEQLLVHILEKVDRMEGHIFDIRESQIRTELDVREHIKRTNLLEEMVKELKKSVALLLLPVEAGRWILKLLKVLK